MPHLGRSITPGLVLLCILITVKSEESIITHFNKTADFMSTSPISMRLYNVSKIECSHACLGQTTFGCLSFDYDKSRKICRLFEFDDDGILTNASGVDYYIRNDVENLTCSPGWFQDTKIRLSCYQANQEPVTYKQAQINCRESHVGGHLESVGGILSRRNQRLLTTLLRDAGVNSSTPAFFHKRIGYYVINRRREEKGYSFEEAKAMCLSKFGSDAQLVTIENDQIAELITSVLETDLSELNRDTERYWIGLKQERSQFLWQDGTAVNYSQWDIGHPNSDYDCVALNYDRDKQKSSWFTIGCSILMSAICQVPLASWIEWTPQNNGTSEWSYNATEHQVHSGVCYKFSAKSIGSFLEEDCTARIPYVCEYEVGTIKSTFTPTPNVTLQTGNFIQINGIIHRDCQTQCVQHQTFFCRSYQYQKTDDLKGVCQISQENTQTVDPFIDENTSGIMENTYYERNVCGLTCQNDGILDEMTCVCVCLQGWFGKECEVTDQCYAPLKITSEDKDSKLNRADIENVDVRYYYLISSDWSPVNSSVYVANISLDAQTWITGISIFGGENEDVDNRVTQFWLEFSASDDNKSQGDIQHDSKTNMLAGNFVQGFTRTHYFNPPYFANEIFVNVNNYHNGVSMGFHLYGCGDDRNTALADTECYTDILARDYRGVVAVTSSGKTCQSWASQSPHTHTRTPSNHPDAGIGDHNYCRNPDEEPEGVWCYTTDPATRREPCDIGEPRLSCDQGESTNEHIIATDTGATSIKTTTESIDEQTITTGRSTTSMKTTTSMTTLLSSLSSSTLHLSTPTSLDQTRNLLNKFKDSENLTKEELINSLNLLGESLNDLEGTLDDDIYSNLLDMLMDVGRTAAHDIESAKAVLNIYDNLADPERMEKQQIDKKIPTKDKLSNLMKGIEDLSAHLRLPNGTDNVKLETTHMVIGVTRVPEPLDGKQSMVALGNTEDVGCVLLPVLDTSVQLSTVVFKTLHNLMDDGRNDSTVASSIISLTASSVSEDSAIGSKSKSIQFSDEKPITFDLKNRKDQNGNLGFDIKAECVYWDDKESEKHKWSTKGCQTVTDDLATPTKCVCNHMTSFAVLFRVTDVKEADLSTTHNVVLEYLTIIGLGSSIAGLFVTIVIYTFCKLFRHRSVMIHSNLIMSLLVAHSLFLCGLKLTSNKTLCKIVAMLLHYFLLVSFAWMMIEGVHLFLKSSVGFRKNIKMWVYCLFGWGTPVIIVGISFGVGFDIYAADNWCWLSNERGLIWAFIAPVLFVLFVNCVVVVLVMRVFMQLKTNKDKDELNRIRAGLRAVLALQPILGLNWLFGFLSMSATSVVFDYLFVIFTSLQGIFILILHCVLNEEVRKSLRMHSAKVSSSTASHSVSQTGNSSILPSRLDTKTTVANISTSDHSGFQYSKVTTKLKGESTA